MHQKPEHISSAKTPSFLSLYADGCQFEQKIFDGDRIIFLWCLLCRVFGCGARYRLQNPPDILHPGKARSSTRGFAEVPLAAPFNAH